MTEAATPEQVLLMQEALWTKFAAAVPYASRVRLRMDAAVSAFQRGLVANKATEIDEAALRNVASVLVEWCDVRAQFQEFIRGGTPTP